MHKGEFRVGEHWAYRQTTVRGEPAIKVALLALATRGRATKIKIRHVEGELEGLTEFVPTTQLRRPWREWQKVERDEQRELALADAAALHEPIDAVVVAAATEVLRASGEPLCIEGVRGYTRQNALEQAVLKRLAKRIDLDISGWLRAPSFVDRHGTL